ncbi:TIGR03013 family XrtA/PEP-CTERM system glycosyltransferase [Dasania marina]|uniref:TIGR03013 family XrtA/PEP-CTERM system glycosyltransferase n=1 Tax=Dasania marina TaxID=471499 RepID=UPI00037FAEC7|nr:TIGR03013 family XrtA/PEP-CTERM system glycosyltransferase [Dasania marina]
MAHIRIFNHYVQSPFIFLALTEFALLAVCAYLGVTQWGWGEEELRHGEVGMRYSLVYALVMLLATFSLGSYAAGVRESFAGMAVRCVVSYCLLGSAAMVILFYLVPGLYIGRRALFGSVLLSLVIILLVRKLFYLLVDISQLRRHVLVLGAGVKAAAIDRVRNEQAIGFDIVGFIPAAPEQTVLPQEKLLDAIGGLQHLVDKYKVDEIVIAVDERRRSYGGYFPLEELLECKLKGVRITEAVQFYERELSQIELSELHPGWMVFGDGFHYSLARDITKRLFDISICSLLLLLVWPLMLFAVVAVFLESGWPVLYTQTRTGLNGVPFKIYKFRSMTQDAEKGGKAVWAAANDARVTRVGAFMRNTRIDELPQIFNILRGEMSFIGPRPERPEFVEELKQSLPYYDFRHRVKPGLMGWAQLNYPYGASIDDAEKKLVYDLYYVKNHSLLLDMLIVVQTVEVILLGKGVR